MSLWLRRKDPDGRVYYISSGWFVFVVLLPAFLGILMAVLLPLVQSCRAGLRG
jgi:hypothetical protein